MAKTKERSVNVSGKPKHYSLGKGKATNARSAATVRRLKMYNNRPTRNAAGKILKHDLQSKELSSTRIMPDRRWFGALFCCFKLLSNFCSDELTGNGLLLLLRWYSIAIVVRLR